MQIKTWHVELFLYEDDDRTSARAVLHTELAEHKEGHGHAVKAPHDPAVPEIGDELAVARALHDLADTLLKTAARDITDIEQRSIRIDFAGPTRVSTRTPTPVPVGPAA